MKFIFQFVGLFLILSFLMTDNVAEAARTKRTIKKANKKAGGISKIKKFNIINKKIKILFNIQKNIIFEERNKYAEKILIVRKFPS